MIDPDKIEELVTFDRLLKDKGFKVEVYDAPQGGSFNCNYEYSCFSDESGLGSKFQEAAEPLVAENGGKVVAWGRSGGFIAQFAEEDKRTDFLKAFSKAASALSVPPEPETITRDQNGGFTLGGDRRRGMF